MAGLEQAAAAGRDISRLASVASFFVSRVDTEVDSRLDKIGTPEAAALRGKAAIANARLAYELYEQRIATPRWQALLAAGAKVQRPLWASTSTKDPAFEDTMYVVELVAPDTVNTMPEATLRATADHAKLRGDTVRGTYEAVPAGVRRPGRSSASATTTWSRCSRTRAWTSSPCPGTSSSAPSRPTWGQWRSHDECRYRGRRGTAR